MYTLINAPKKNRLPINEETANNDKVGWLMSVDQPKRRDRKNLDKV